MDMTMKEFAQNKGCRVKDVYAYISHTDDKTQAFYNNRIRYGNAPDGSDTYLSSYAKYELEKKFDFNKFREEYPELIEVTEEEIEANKEEAVAENVPETVTETVEEPVAEETASETEGTPEVTEMTAEEVKFEDNTGFTDNAMNEPVEDTENIESEKENTTMSTEEARENFMSRVNESREADNAAAETDKAEAPSGMTEVTEKPKRHRRTKAELEAARQAEGKSNTPAAAPKKRGKLNVPKGYFKNDETDATEVMGGIKNTKMFLVSNGMKLEEVAYLTDEEVKSLFNKEYTVIGFNDSKLVVRKLSLESIREDVFFSAE